MPDCHVKFLKPHQFFWYVHIYMCTDIGHQSTMSAVFINSFCERKQFSCKSLLPAMDPSERPFKKAGRPRLTTVRNLSEGFLPVYCLSIFTNTHGAITMKLYEI